MPRAEHTEDFHFGETQRSKRERIEEIKKRQESDQAVNKAARAIP